MGLLDSSRKRNERLLAEACSLALNRVGRFFSDEHGLCTAHAAWLNGGWIAAQNALWFATQKNEADPLSALRNSWGNGDDRKARSILGVFTLCMVSSWHRTAFPADHQAEHRAELCMNGASNILLALNLEPDQFLEDFERIDVQFNYEETFAQRGGSPTFLEGLIGWWAATACHGASLGLSKVAFPTDLRGYAEQGGHLGWGGMDFLFVAQACASGIDSMWRVQRDLRSVPDVAMQLRNLRPERLSA